MLFGFIQSDFLISSTKQHKLLTSKFTQSSDYYFISFVRDLCLFKNGMTASNTLVR